MGGMMRFLKYGLGILMLGLAGLILGFVLAAYGSISLLWSFPSAWEPLRGLSGVPKELLALDAENDRLLVRTADSQLFTCQGATCAPAESNWSANAPCDASTRPAVTRLFPYMLSWEIRSVLACERSYTDIARTTSLAYTGKGTWRSTDVNLLPTDASIVGVGLFGGLIGLLAGIVTGAVISLVLVWKNRRQSQNLN
jgi:hypothetical protein